MENKLIKTKSFELAINISGNENSDKLAILIPGRLDTKDYIHFTSHSDLFAKFGYLAVTFDPAGTWQSPGDISLCTTTNYIKSINELIEYFGNKPTILLGHSRGGTAAILTSMVNENVKGIIPIMANFGAPTAPSENDIKVGYHLSYRDLAPGDKPTETKKEFKLPLSYWEDGKKYNIIEAINKCAKPKLIVYGTDDEFTKPNEVKELFKDIPNPKMILEVNSTHDYRYFLDIILQIEKNIKIFLTENNL